MTNNVTVVPWHDGTRRVVPLDSILVTERGRYVRARTHGCYSATPQGAAVPWSDSDRASRLLVEAPAPPIAQPAVPDHWVWAFVTIAYLADGVIVMQVKTGPRGAVLARRSETQETCLALHPKHDRVLQLLPDLTAPADPSAATTDGDPS